MRPDIKQRLIAELHAYSDNPRVHSPAQISALSDSLLKFGWTAPILVDADDNVLAGHGRILAATLLGWIEAPVIQLDTLTEAQAKAYRLLDNKLAEQSFWDDAFLSKELGELDKLNINMSNLGFLPEGEEMDVLRYLRCPTCSHEFEA